MPSCLHGYRWLSAYGAFSLRHSQREGDENALISYGIL